MTKADIPTQQSRPLESVFKFLKANRQWNADFQRREIDRHLTHCESPHQRLRALLHVVLRTQSQPSIHSISQFWHSFESFSVSGENTLERFTKHLDELKGTRRPHKGRWRRLYSALRAQPGWGEKTAALFVRASIQLHRSQDRHHFWSDNVAATVEEPDRIYLPVDNVIKNVLTTTHQVGAPTFGYINKLLTKDYPPEEMLLWDDLWFWGYFTQNAQAEKRTLGWNSDKYWCEPSASKVDEPMLRQLGEEFIALILAEANGNKAAKASFVSKP